MSERMIAAAQAIAKGKPATIPLMRLGEFPDFIKKIKDALQKNIKH